MSSCISGCNSCPMKSQCTSSKAPEALHLSITSQFANKHLLAVMSGKGGVGKSTVAAATAQALASLGTVTLVDLDIAGPSIPRITNTTPSLELGEVLTSTPLSESFRVITPPLSLLSQNHVPGAHVLNYLAKIQESSEIIVFDMPPGTSDAHITLSKLFPQLKVLLVATGHPLSLSDLQREITFCQKTQLEIIGLIENMAAGQCTHCAHSLSFFPTNDLQALCQDKNIPILQSIPINQQIAKDSDAGTVPNLITSQTLTQIHNRLFGKFS
ncbi:hypothetical protein NEHOM01_1382 [Nematocida homosporus]|uniref:uncharacterized protein n=1 Tax=Nematocida homosporus TaxID=1912981 RepID=UPI002220783E|nr:uncharacterized protein NEHOM01_1382 [Nematocida homosporus]KAI5186318.1 hypothetical protein NEHOM01_1382 [Nematocida homosporus]